MRSALRDCLYQAGIPSNPLWTDSDIVASIADKLGVQNRYQNAADFTRKQAEASNQKKQKTPNNP